jgi:hypothetical protein
MTRLIYLPDYPPAGNEFVGNLKHFMGKKGFIGKAPYMVTKYTVVT